MSSRLRKSCICLWALAALTFSGPARAETSVSGVIDEDTTWTLANSPYVVSGAITLVGAHLVVESGVQVMFDYGQNLNIDSESFLDIAPGCRFDMSGNHIFVNGGRLVADGTPEKPIVFGRRTPATGWGNLNFNNASSLSMLDYCRLSGATVHGIVITSAAPSNPLLITNNTIESNEPAIHVIHVENANPVIANNLIIYNGDNGNAIFVIISNAHKLYPNLSMNSIVRTVASRSSEGIHFHYYDGVSIELKRNRVKNFSVGVSFFRDGNDTYGTHLANIEECILHENDTSIYYRVNHYAGVSYTTRNNWLRYANVVWGGSCSILACASDQDYWTLPFPDRSNQTDSVLICTNERTAPPFPEGDVDDDGDTDRDDARMVGDYLVGNITTGEMPNAADADADGNGTIDARDMALIRAFAEGMIWKLPR